MSAEVDRPKVTFPLKMTGRINQDEFFGNSKGDRPQVSSRHNSFSQEEKLLPPKRRYSERFVSGSAAHGFRKKFARFTNRGNFGKIILPTKFLLGGNICDPLNLNSLCDEEVNRSLNKVTPISSPMPVPGHRLESKVPIIHPANIHDPLGLEDSDENAGILMFSPTKQKSQHSRQRKRRHTNKRQSKDLDKSECKEDDGMPPPLKLMKPLSIEINAPSGDVQSCPSSKDNREIGELFVKKIVDKIVSPVIPQTSPKRKRRHTISEARLEVGECGLNAAQACENEKPAKSERAAPIRRSNSKRNSTQFMPHAGFKGKNAKFVHGNYSTYYGYHNSTIEDNRLKMFPKDIFKGKDVLDIGCNIGHVTLGVAQNFAPRRITGIDVDRKIIEAAKKNLRHYWSDDVVDRRYPVSLKIMHGPILSHPLMEGRLKMEEGKFPHNVTFQESNYYLEAKDVQSQQPEYDVILALGITKWIHLNYGDAGLKQCFLRMFRQLRPGGTLILEAQKWGSYRKKKKLTPNTYQIFKSIRFRPDQFREFLTSKHIGFTCCRFLGSPSNKSKGSNSTVHIFTKDVSPEPSRSPPQLLKPARSEGLLSQLQEASSFCSSSVGGLDGTSVGSATPRFEVGSTRFTPCSTCHDTPSNAYLSQSCTPWTERTCSSVEDVHPSNTMDFVVEDLFQETVTPSFQAATEGSKENGLDENSSCSAKEEVTDATGQ